MNRRGFLKGLVAVPLATAIPVLALAAEPVFIGIDWGAGDDFTAHRRFQIEEICRYFSVPLDIITPNQIREMEGRTATIVDPSYSLRCARLRGNGAVTTQSGI